jgi:hypothetical protein
MSETVSAMIAKLGPLDPEQAVLCALARQLAATLDAMKPTIAAKMSGQTAGALLRVLDKLGVPRKTSSAPPAVEAAPVAAKPPGEVWYEGIEDTLYACQLEWIIQRHAQRSGGRLPVPGTEAYSRNPWAPDPWEWVEAQKGPRPRRRLP